MYEKREAAVEEFLRDHQWLLDVPENERDIAAETFRAGWNARKRAELQPIQAAEWRLRRARAWRRAQGD